jgi:hypothetical protein
MSEFLTRLASADRYFKDSRYANILVKAHNYYNRGDELRANLALERLPDKNKLLRILMKELRGKPVEKNLRRVADGKVTDVYGVLKSLYSLGTHIVIELEKGNMEYRMLLEGVFLKIQASMANQKQ